MKVRGAHGIFLNTLCVRNIPKCSIPATICLFYES